MAKEQATTDLAPQLFSTGGHVFFEDPRAIAKLLNHSFGYRPQTHLATFGRGIASGGLAGVWHAVGSSIGVWRTVIDCDVRVRPEITTLIKRTRPYCFGDCELSVRWTIGAGGADTSGPYDSGDHNFTYLTTSNTSSTGTGWLRVLVEIKRDAGTGDGGLLSVGLRDGVLTGANVPSPQDA